MNIIEIEHQNPWWNNKNWVKEDLHLNKYKNSPVSHEWTMKLEKGVCVVYGPRQVGKTTWIKQQISKLENENVLYIACDGILSTKEFKDTLTQIFELKDFKYIFLDEIAYIDNWEQIIKYFIDQKKFKDKYLVLTGSSSINMLKKAERLTGRLSKKKRFHPLTFKEFVDNKIKNPTTEQLYHLFRRYLLHGGFLKVINKFEQANFISADLLSDYSGAIDGELSKAQRSPRIFNYIISKLISALTNTISWASISENEVSQPTVSEYIEISKLLMFNDYIENIESYHKSFVKNKKVYFFDPFLFWIARYRIGKKEPIDETNILKYESKLVENAVFSNISTYLDDRIELPDFEIRDFLFYSKTRKGEIDFVINNLKLEVKWTKDIRKKEKDVLYLTKTSLAKNEVPVYLFLYNIDEYLKNVKLQTRP
ncbi:ATP-binding protein [Candidatus Micrarchaeota archaeon]|nr:ATP-binding protein [Candidatus Micrarchaeota archaeon]